VKQTIKILGVYFLAAIYCLAIIFVTNRNIQTSFSTKSSVLNESIFSDISSKLFNHTPKSENTLSDKDNLPNSSFKNNFGEFTSLFYQKNNLFNLRYKQYTTQINKILVHTRKSDILFPFHYFW
jgi:hypothetical protein